MAVEKCQLAKQTALFTTPWYDPNMEKGAMLDYGVSYCGLQSLSNISEEKKNTTCERETRGHTKNADQKCRWCPPKWMCVTTQGAEDSVMSRPQPDILWRLAAPFSFLQKLSTCPTFPASDTLLTKRPNRKTHTEHTWDLDIILFVPAQWGREGGWIFQTCASTWLKRNPGSDVSV